MRLSTGRFLVYPPISRIGHSHPSPVELEEGEIAEDKPGRGDCSHPPTHDIRIDDVIELYDSAIHELLCTCTYWRQEAARVKSTAGDTATSGDAFDDELEDALS